MGNSMKFTGEYIRTLDSKNRTVLPPAFKNVFDGRPFFLAYFPKDKGKCLRIYDEEELNEILEKGVFAPGQGEEGQNLQRKVFRRIFKCELDVQNRFVISQNLLDFAGITKDVQLNGVGKRIEIWNPDIYRKYVENLDDDDDSLDGFDYDY